MDGLEQRLQETDCKGRFGRSMTLLSLPSLKLPYGAKFWKKRSANISECDPTFRAIYLGNVLTSWAKGDGCADKPLATLWKNYTSTDKPNIIMKVTVCASGLKALTKEHGLTEYWANRITFCDADPDYPKVFCWIYRHEGRKMKQELRCHAVLCPSENKAKKMCKKLHERLHQALIDFKKEKISRQNARLSLANSAYENPSMPYRKILLQTGSANYRAPVERGKAAPKLKVIEEAIIEEEEAEQKCHLVSSQSVDVFQQPEMRIGNMRVSQSEMDLCVGETRPLLQDCESRRTSYSTDNLSIASTVVEDGSGGVGSLIIISDNPRAEKSRRINAVESHTARSNITYAVNDFNLETYPTMEEDFDRLSDEDDEDQVTDYLHNLRIDVDSATASLSSDSGRHMSRSSRTSSVSAEDDKLSEAASAKNPEEQQDTISDESGHSDEHLAFLDELNCSRTKESDVDSHLDNSSIISDCDLTVKGVMISEFTTAERFRYLQRSRNNVQKDFLQNKVTEFCINI